MKPFSILRKEPPLNSSINDDDKNTGENMTRRNEVTSARQNEAEDLAVAQEGVDEPEGAVTENLWRCPRKKNSLQQNYQPLRDDSERSYNVNVQNQAWQSNYTFFMIFLFI